MTPTEAFEAIGRGVVQQLLASAPAASPAAMLPAETDAPSGAASPPEAPSVIKADLPTPSFDQLEEQALPGFEDIPPATLAAMEKAVKDLQRGNGPPIGFYDPQEADQRAPLS